VSTSTHPKSIAHLDQHMGDYPLSDLSCPPSYSDISFVPMAYRFLPDDPLVRSCVPSTEQCETSDSTITASSKALDSSSDDVFRFFLSHLESPQIYLKIRGYHQETELYMNEKSEVVHITH
jgi:hypothetical protein